MKIFICNAFSLSMLDREVQTHGAIDAVYEPAHVPRPVSDEALAVLVAMANEGRIDVESAVGHADTAAVFSNILGFPVRPNRISVKLTKDTKALIGQYVGPRLPEGATELPEGARIEWWIV